MKKKAKETGHNLWYRVMARALCDEGFRERLLKAPAKVLHEEKVVINQCGLEEIVNDPEKIKRILEVYERCAQDGAEDLEQRLAAFGYFDL